MRVNELQGWKFDISYYFDLLTLLDLVLDRYGIEKDELLPYIHSKWVLEGVSSLKLIRDLAADGLKQVERSVVRRACDRSTLIAWHPVLSKQKNSLVQMIAQSYNDVPNSFKEKVDRLLIPFIDRCFYEEFLVGEPCLTFMEGKLLISLRSK